MANAVMMGGDWTLKGLVCGVAELDHEDTHEMFVRPDYAGLAVWVASAITCGSVPAYGELSSTYPTARCSSFFLTELNTHLPLPISLLSLPPSPWEHSGRS